MALKASLLLSGIAIGLLVIYGADVAAGSGEAGKGFLPFDAITRGIGFGSPPIVLSIIAYFISKKEPSKSLGAMIIAIGILIIIGGAVSLSIISSGETDNIGRSIGEGGGLIAIGGFITALGFIKIKKS